MGLEQPQDDILTLASQKGDLREAHECDLTHSAKAPESEIARASGEEEEKLAERALERPVVVALESKCNLPPAQDVHCIACGYLQLHRALSIKPSAANVFI